jgi:CHAD domain-containing protein
MSFELESRTHLDRELAKKARKELRDTARALTTSEGGTFEKAVHESRKRLKKVRAIAALLEQVGTKVPRKDRKQLKSVAHALSRIRDSAAIIETFDRVRRRYPKQLSPHTYRTLRHGLVDARNRAQAEAERDDVVDGAAARLVTTRKAIKDWPSHAIDVSDLLAVVAGSYRRSRRAMKRARLTGQSATVHSWRKEVKTFWYQLRLAKRLTVGVAPLITDLKRLETELGDDHNLVVLEATLRGCCDLRTQGAAIRQVGRLATRMRQQLRRRAFTLGRRVYGRRPKTFHRWARIAAKRTSAPRAAAA